MKITAEKIQRIRELWALGYGVVKIMETLEISRREMVYYHVNPKRRIQQNMLSNRWKLAHPEKAKEMNRRAVKKWQKNNRIKLNELVKAKYKNDEKYREKRKESSRKYKAEKRAKKLNKLLV